MTMQVAHEVKEEGTTTRYLEAAQDAVQTLLDKQSKHWGDDPAGVLGIVVSRLNYRDFTSIGTGVEKGTYYTCVFSGQDVETDPARLDMRSWRVLELFSDVTGDPKYRGYVKAMAREFVRDGFDPVSGLPYLGETADFDVTRRAPVSINSQNEYYFKPNDCMPLDALWAAAPAAMARMCHSMFYGLIQRAETMEYNRFCEYGFDADNKKFCYEYNSHHCATAYAAAYMIHWWGDAFVRTGDSQLHEWAEKMTDKWLGAQHPESWLVPAWFGSNRTDDPVMPPKPFCNNWDANTSVTFLRAAEEWKKHPETQTLATKLETLGHRLAVGMARHGYDAKSRTFPQWTNVDGSPRLETTWYTFYSQEEKDEVLARDPKVHAVDVMYGSGFYEGIRPWMPYAGNPLPYSIALVAQKTGDAELLARAKEFAALIIEETRALKAEFNDKGQAMFAASAAYVKMMLVIFEMTGEKQYLDWAREIADKELELLRLPVPEGKHPWWRVQGRDTWIEALLLLHRAGS